MDRTTVQNEADDSARAEMQAGVDNMLFNCMGAQGGDSLVIVCEPDNDDYYSPTLAQAVAGSVRKRELNVEIIGVPFLEDASDFPNHVRLAMETADHTLFLARIGDQVRFAKLAGAGTKTMCYALDEASFASPFCSADYRFFLELKHLINSALWGNKEITITCPAGTHLVGTSPADPGDDETGDVMLRRFPMTVFRPVPGNTFSGRMAISKWLCSTGSLFYQPDSVLLDSVVIAHVVNGRIIDLEGNPGDVSKVRDHYEFVAEKYGLDKYIVHSWHAGFHPRNGYDGLALRNLLRWSGSAFGNPRYLHLHTCGNYAPGEICVSVFDPTISVEAAKLWDDGKLVFAETAQVRELFNRYPGIDELFTSPEREFGLDDT